MPEGEIGALHAVAFQNIFTDIVSVVITLIYNSAARYFKAYDGRAGGPGEASQQRRIASEVRGGSCSNRALASQMESERL